MKAHDINELIDFRENRDGSVRVEPRTPVSDDEFIAYLVSDAAGKFADYQMQLIEGGSPGFGLRAAFVASFLKGWEYAMRSTNSGGPEHG
jgi:hypothetical protein